MPDTYEKRVKQRISELVNYNLEAVTPGLQIQSFWRGRKALDIEMGETFRFYDLASLTKIIFTVTQFMLLFDQKKFKPQQKVKDVLPWWKHPTTFLELLTHSGGLPAWLPAHKKIPARGTRAARRLRLQELLQKAKFRKKKKSVYSDPDFWMLGFAMEELCQAPLEDIWQSLHARLNIKSLHFCLNNRPLYKRTSYAPTETCPWRKKTLRGEVHDDNTWVLGGMAAHAGLFGTIDDVSDWGLQLRKAWRGDSERFCKTATAQLFTRRHTPASRGDFGLGFWKPTPGGSSAGHHFSQKSYGHLGFTGTSYWYDPTRDLQVVILSNRVHPTRENNIFKSLRGPLHDIVVEEME